MTSIAPDSPLGAAATRAVRDGDVGALERLLAEHPQLATARIGGRRTLLHVATDWPANFPNVAATVGALVSAGAEVDAPFHGAHAETPLHWAASSDDVEALDALLDAGADIEAPGSIAGGGTPLADAVAFGQWNAARRLVERGARADLWQAAALGLVDRVEAHFTRQQRPRPDEIDDAFWWACHGGERKTAEYLLARGADLDRPGHDDLTPLDAARRGGADDLVGWLCARSARSARELS